MNTRRHPLSELPMRQQTRSELCAGSRCFSELPMRQQTFNSPSGLRRDISELPMRQQTLAGTRRLFMCRCPAISPGCCGNSQ